MFRLNVHVPFSRIPLLSQATRQEGCLGTHSTQTIHGCNAARYTRDDGQVAESGDWLYVTAHKQRMLWYKESRAFLLFHRAPSLCLL